MSSGLELVMALVSGSSGPGSCLPKLKWNFRKLKEGMKVKKKFWNTTRQLIALVRTPQVGGNCLVYVYQLKMLKQQIKSSKFPISINLFITDPLSKTIYP